MRSKFIIIVLALIASTFSECRKAAGFEDAIYFTGTEQVPETKFTIDGPSSIGVSVTSSAKVDKDTKVDFSK